MEEPFMVQLPDLPGIHISGPFWTADADVIQLADPVKNTAWRALFVDINPRVAVRQPSVLLPGTLLALVYVTSVTISPTSDGKTKYVWGRNNGSRPDGAL